MKATEWFAQATAEGAFCAREEAVTESPVKRFRQPVDNWDAERNCWVTVWSDTGLHYDERGGR